MESSLSSVAESRIPRASLPKAAFRLKLGRGAEPSQEIRWAVYRPFQSRLLWEDNGEPILAESMAREEEFFSFPPVSPETPGRKSSNLKLIKVQVGFGCNFSCGYCSQKSFRPAFGVGSEADAQAFLRGFSSWYGGGEDGKGRGTRIDFLGGETLLYWSLVRSLARGIKKQYPNITFSLYTNGSVAVDDLAEEALALQIQVTLSHDGLMQKQNRGRDPLLEETGRIFLRGLAAQLLPQGLFAVQMTLGKDSFSLTENRLFLSEALQIPAPVLPLVFDIVYAFESAKSMTSGERDEIAAFQSRVLRELRAATWAGALAYAIFRRDIAGFLDPLLGRSSMASTSQRCDMDRASSIAVDLKGNVLTCQNTTAKGGHKIGHVEAFSDIRLNTGFHWSYRESCRACPVAAMCKGACMYIQGDEFRKTCDSMFAYYLSVLAFALENITGWTLTEIQGGDIRACGVTSVSLQ